MPRRPPFVRCLAPASRAALAITLALTLALAAPAALAAQTAQTGTLEGRVTLASGRAIANALVRVRLADGAYPRETRSDPAGAFRIPFLPPGRYELVVRQLGFREVRVTAVAIGVAAVTVVDVTLERARDTLPAVIVTEAAPPGASAADAAQRRAAPLTPDVTFALSARERERLPAPRDANALVRFIPGVRPGQLFGGSTNQANLYQLDGVTVNQPGTGGSFLLPNVDWLEDVRVVGLGAGAEYGNFQGGLVNLVTKSGSNTLQGTLRSFTEQRGLNAPPARDVALPSALDDRLEVSGELRGPLLRDRLYFFVSGQEVRTRERVAGAPGGGAVAGGAVGSGTAASDAAAGGGWLDARRERRQQTYYGKLTWQASARDLVHASLGVDNLRRERVGLSPFVAPAATSRGESPSLFSQLLWQRAQGGTGQFEARLSGYTGRDDELPYGGARQPSIALLDAPQVPRFVNATYTRRNRPQSIAAHVLQQLLLREGAVTHDVKVGADATFGRWRERRTRNGGLSWYTEGGADFDPLAPGTWRTIPSLGLYATADTGGTIDLDAGTLNAALFLQDDVRVRDRLSLSLGVRLGLWRGTLTPGNRTDDARPFTAVRALGVDPRLGVTVDLSGDRRWLARGHWGRYHQNLFALHFDRAPNAGLYTNLDYCDWNDPTGTNRPEVTRPYTPAEFASRFTCFPGPTLSTEAERVDRYRQPFVDQVTLGLDRALGPSLRAQLLYVGRTNGNVLALRDDRLARNWSPIENVRVADARGPVRGPDGEPVVLPRLWVRSDDLADRLAAGDAVPGYVPSDSLRFWFDPEYRLGPVGAARRRFEQLQLVLTGRWTRADLTAALAWTNLRGNFFSVSGYLDPSGSGNGPWAEPNVGTNANGRLSGFSPWDLTVRASGALPWGLEGGAFVAVQAGDFWTPTLPISRQLTYDAIGSDGRAVRLHPDLVRSATGQAILLEPRGSRQLGWLATVDLRVQKTLAIGRQTLAAGVEVFNLLDSRAVTARKASVLDQLAADPASLVGAVQARQGARSVRVMVRWGG